MGEMILAVASEKRLQLVPNWNGITTPETTPMPKATAKMRVQKPEMRNQISLAGDELRPFQKRDIGSKPDRQCRQKYVPGDHPGELQTRQEQWIEMHARGSFMRDRVRS